MTTDTREGEVETVQVALRIRPLVQSEIERGCEECIEVVPGEPQVHIKDIAFTYNYVFPPHIGQQEFYDTAVKKFIGKLFKGYNATILAYGQTGSGKTYSMGTNCTGCEGDPNSAGVIPQAVHDIFEHVKENEHKFAFKVSVSFMELYQEQCYDLLSGKQRNHSIIEIREDHRGVVLPGLSEIIVSSELETLMCLMKGSEGRAVGATAMNAVSSRSHAIFTIYIYKESLTDKNDATTAKFHLVDLAGSERAKKTMAKGDRLKEGIKINQGLLALGNVISALGDGTNRGFICYRDSKLTRLLQDSLGGNSVTLMVACVSPADYNLEETVSTLRYADRARRIRNKPRVNQDAKAAEILRLNNMVNDLRLQLLGKAPIKTENCNCSVQLEAERKKYSDLLAKHTKMTDMLNSLLIDNASQCEKAIIAESVKEKLERKLNELAEKCNQTLENFNQTYDKSQLECDSPNAQLLEQIKEMKSKLEEMQSDSVKYNDEMMEHEIRSTDSIKEEDNDSLGDIEQVEDEEGALRHNEAHAIDRVAMNKELNELNQAMAMKAIVVKQMMANTRELVTYNENLKENEVRIGALEKEKNDLMQQLKNAQTKMKDPVTDERRNKVKLLEQEIADLRKKCQHQQNLIRAKERNEAKINMLNNEIQNMKVAKVNLLKRMRTESEKFRRWKAESERDVCRLRAADRKRANAMAKMETMHARQQNVLKRKMEETVAVNRRLKEALERQKAVALKRQMSTNKAEVIAQWVEQELETQLSTVDAQRTLQDLMDDRRILMSELERLKSESSDDNTSKIEDCENELQLRKAQINDLQQKILTADHENNARTRWENISTLVEARCALKYLFEALIENKKEQQLNKNSNHLAQLQEERDALMKEYEQAKRQFEKKIDLMEMQHEEKLSALIKLSRGVTVTGMSSDAVKTLEGHISLQRERLDKLEAEKEELEKELEGLRAASGGKRKNKSKASSSRDQSRKTASATEEDDSDDADDPTWRATPMIQRLRPHRSRITLDTFASPELETTHAVARATKRGSDGATQCGCRGACSTRCGCRRAGEPCGALCKCPRVVCTNRKAEMEKENAPSLDEKEQNENIIEKPSFFDSTGHDTLVKKKKSYYYPEGSDD